MSYMLQRVGGVIQVRRLMLVVVSLALIGNVFVAARARAVQLSRTITYSGHMGVVSGSHPILMELHDNSSFAHHSRVATATVATSPGSFTLDAPAPGNYYLGFAFDAGEPFQIFNNKGEPPGDPVMALPNQTAINFQFADDNLASGSTPTPAPSVASATPTPTPTPSPTPGCVGDCDGNGRVTVDDILRMVNIALGNALIGACEAGDRDHDGRITVNEILTAVNNALNGCPVPGPTATPTNPPITHMVAVAPNGTRTFSPPDLSIKVGDTVEWIWSSSGHNVVSGSGCAADSQFCSPNDSNCAQAPTSSQGTIYSHTFTVAGTYPYFCNVHCGFGMVGSITVQ